MKTKTAKSSFPSKPVAIIQLWQQKTCGSPETERGFSLHMSPEDAEKFAEQYWKSQPGAKDLGNVPERYVATIFEPFKIPVSQKLYQELLRANKRGELGIRKEFAPPPPPIPSEFTTLDYWDPGLLRKANGG